MKELKSSQDTEFKSIIRKVLKENKRYLKRNGRFISSDISRRIQLTILNQISLPIGIKEKIISKCNQGATQQSFIVTDFSKVDFFGNTLSESCIENLIRLEIENKLRTQQSFSSKSLGLPLAFGIGALGATIISLFL